MNQFNNAKEIRCANGLALIVNPFGQKPIKLMDHSELEEYQKFENWAEEQPILFCDKILSGIYPVGEFGEVVTQIKTRVRRLPGYDWVSIQSLITPEITLEMLLEDVDRRLIETRQFIQHIGPKKQEANCNGCGKEILDGEVFYTVHNGDDYCKDCYDAIQSDDESSGRLNSEPATPEQKGVEQGEETNNPGYVFRANEIEKLYEQHLGNLTSLYVNEVLTGHEYKNLTERIRGKRKTMLADFLNKFQSLNPNHTQQ